MRSYWPSASTLRTADSKCTRRTSALCAVESRTDRIRRIIFRRNENDGTLWAVAAVGPRRARGHARRGVDCHERLALAGPADQEGNAPSGIRPSHNHDTGPDFHVGKARQNWHNSTTAVGVKSGVASANRFSSSFVPPAAIQSLASPFGASRVVRRSAPMPRCRGAIGRLAGHGYVRLRRCRPAR